jgi:hypothetical protein
MSAHPLQGWTPVWIGQSATGTYVDWCNLGPERFIDPFFEQTVGRTMMNPAQLLFRQRTGFAEVVELAKECPGLKPSALIFHLSRCGSTLISQMLATSPKNLAIAEATPLDSVIFAAAHGHDIDRAVRIEWLRAMVSALGQPRHGEAHFFLKLDSWHVLELPLIAEAFPDVPRIFLYRDPLDVLLSHERQRGSQMIPSLLPAQVFNFTPPWTPAVSFDEYAAWVLARICRDALKYAGVGRGRLVHYSELTQVFPELCAEFFKIAYTAGELKAMASVTQFHSKRPGMMFSDETAERRKAAKPELLALSERLLAEPYAQLEALRAGQGPIQK